MNSDELNLIRKVAWSYAKRFPGWEFDELLSEACLAYLLVRHQYNPERGALSTFIWRVVSNHLNVILGREARRAEKQCPLDEADTKECRQSWEEKLAEMSPEARYIIARVISQSATMPKRRTAAQRHIASLLLQEGWSMATVWAVFREIKEMI